MVSALQEVQRSCSYSRATERARLDVEWLGELPYADALALQHAAVDARRRGETADRLLLLEHPPVVTLGSSAKSENVLVSQQELAARGIALHRARRGGDVTFHAPGQLVGYLIVDLDARGTRDGRAILRAIEEALIVALRGVGLPSRRIGGMTGVFSSQQTVPAASCPARKLASIGIGVRRWVTYHGFALNVGIDLAGFDVVVPCGMDDILMTSVERELSVEGEARTGLARATRRHVADAFRERFAFWPADPT